MEILIMDEYGGIEREIGCLMSKEIDKLLLFAKQRDFDCLIFLDNNYAVIFNYLQIKKIKSEIEQAKHILSKTSMHYMKEAFRFLEHDDYLYLVFAP